MVIEIYGFRQPNCLGIFLTVGLSGAEADKAEVAARPRPRPPPTGPHRSSPQSGAYVRTAVGAEALRLSARSPRGQRAGEVAILVDGRAAECAAQHCAQQASGIHLRHPPTAEAEARPRASDGCLRGSEVPVSGGV